MRRVSARRALSGKGGKFRRFDSRQKPEEAEEAGAKNGISSLLPRKVRRMQAPPDGTSRGALGVSQRKGDTQRTGGARVFARPRAFPDRCDTVCRRRPHLHARRMAYDGLRRGMYDTVREPRMEKRRGDPCGMRHSLRVPRVYGAFIEDERKLFRCSKVYDTFSPFGGDLFTFLYLKEK